MTFLVSMMYNNDHARDKRHEHERWRNLEGQFNSRIHGGQSLVRPSRGQNNDGHDGYSRHLLGRIVHGLKMILWYRVTVA